MGQENKPHWQEVMERLNKPEQWMKKSPEQQANERLKFEITEELGLLSKVENFGWKGLTARETGRIGGRMNQKKKEKRNGES